MSNQSKHNAAQTTNNATASGYAPEVENRRQDYERLAESFITMIQLESERLGNLLDIEGDDAALNTRPLSNALDVHLRALLYHADWWDARTMRRFYTEMRLHGDQLEWERTQSHRAFMETQPKAKR